MLIYSILTKFKKFIVKCYYHNNPVEYSRHLGVRIGDGCKIHADPDIAFSTEPFLIRIGDHVLIANGVRLLTHDGSGFTLSYQRKEVYYDIWGG